MSNTVDGYIHLALSTLSCLKDKGFNKELAEAMQKVLNLDKHIKKEVANE